MGTQRAIQIWIHDGSDAQRRWAGGVAGEPPAGDGFFVAPTILADLAPDAAAARQEIFGPVGPDLPGSDAPAAWMR